MASSSTTSGAVKVRCLRGVRRKEGDLPMGTVIELSLDELAAAPAGLYRRLSDERDPVAEAKQARDQRAQAEAAAKEAEAAIIARKRAEQAQLQLQQLLVSSQVDADREALQREVKARDQAYAQARGLKK